ncbi:dimethylarginine dimethylaminohydrolase family protein [Lichenicola sp.]|uniref:dimethylarginine dimethylaminohydrolase family protein n=1 Tax=Lichenicola sp. TaxID=2804529 RepID=UPI003B003D4C
MTPTYLLVEPSHYEVSYSINPWMKPGVWSEHPEQHLAEARAAFTALKIALRDAGGEVRVTDGAPGLPDMVFPANAGIVLDRKALVASFRHPQRQGEEAVFKSVFERLQAEGVLDQVESLPAGMFQEGAGDCIWDRTRSLAWTGYGPRSSPEAPAHIARVFDIDIVRLELATEQFYHLDTCFCVLPHGEVFYYPAAFTKAGLGLIRDVVPADRLMEATADDAARFCVNAVAIDRTIVMAQPTARLKQRFAERGYMVKEVGLAPFILSGGGAYCMTLRLDLATRGHSAGVDQDLDPSEA